MTIAIQIKHYAHQNSGGVKIIMYIPKFFFFGNQLVEESLCSLKEYRDLFLALDSRKRTEPTQPYRRFIAYIYCVEMSTLGGELRSSNLDFIR